MVEGPSVALGSEMGIPKMHFLLVLGTVMTILEHVVNCISDFQYILLIFCVVKFRK